jgi:hypothetical protein
MRRKKNNCQRTKSLKKITTPTLKSTDSKQNTTESFILKSTAIRNKKDLGSARKNRQTNHQQPKKAFDVGAGTGNLTGKLLQMGY